MDTRGQELCRFDAKNWESGIEVEGGAALWARRDGLWGLVALKGPHAGEWRAEPVYRSVYEKGEGVYSLMRADYTWVLMDAKGDIIGPGWVDPETVEMQKQMDAYSAAVDTYEQMSPEEQEAWLDGRSLDEALLSMWGYGEDEIREAMDTLEDPEAAGEED